MMRWPMHPELIEGERLSSWLRRIGMNYGVSVDELLKSLGFEGLKAGHVDVKAPGALIRIISERTGVSVPAVRVMTFAGAFPKRLLTKLPLARGESRFLSVLWEKPKRRNGRPGEIRWIRREGGARFTACRECLGEYPNSGVMLAWRLGVVLSCPIHQILLEPAEVDGTTIIWFREHSEAAPALVSIQDRRNYSALLEGFVELPGEIIGDEKWYRLLSAIFQELEHSVDVQNSERWNWQRELWSKAGYLPREFGELFEFDLRCAKLVAAAIDQMEKEHIFPTGTEGFTFIARESERWKAIRRQQAVTARSRELYF